MRTHFLMGTVAGFAILRLALAIARMRLYRARQRLFQESDPAHVRAEWRRTLGSAGRWTAAWIGSVLLIVGISAVVFYYPATPQRFRDGVAGFAVYWLLGRVCVECYYLVNRYLALARPEMARRAARRFPKAGLAVEAMLVAFVALPAFVGAAAEGRPFLVWGAVALGIQELVALWRWATIGHEIVLAEPKREGLR